MRTMENENLRVQISDHGAELSSIYDKAADREAVWTGDPAFWNRHAPVLFPFVGKVNGGFYTHKGVKYPMGQHGFARDNEFECIENTENKTVHRWYRPKKPKKSTVRFCLHRNPGTLRQNPDHNLERRKHR